MTPAEYVALCEAAISGIAKIIETLRATSAGTVTLEQANARIAAVHAGLARDDAAADAEPAGT